MKLTLTQIEIEEALKQYVFATISIKDGTDIKIDFTAGRGEKGLTAEIDINYLGVKSIDISPREAKAPEEDTRVQEQEEPVVDDSLTPDVTARAGNSLFERG